MLLDISFWLILFCLWFVYTAQDSRIKTAFIIGSPVIMLMIAFVKYDYVHVFTAAALILSHSRYILNRYGKSRLRRIHRKTWIITLLSAVLLLIARWILQYHASWFLSVVALLWALFSVRTFYLATKRSVGSIYRPSKQSSRFADNELPTVTLAIPARNETPVLTDCLRSAVSSSYPKLEILVLDDCSYDSTPEIIKSFAHDGVRFISGEAPASGWIGKNQAYEALASQASGRIIIFAGVDTRWDSGSITRLVEAFLQADVDMMSVSPYRQHFDILPILGRSLRYYQQVAIARLPVMNSVWLVRRNWLYEKGGFAPIKHTILPERKLAALAHKGGRYKYIISNPKLGVTSRKRASSQFETAIRTLYPQAAKDPLLAVLWSFGWLSLLVVWLLSWQLSAPIYLFGAILISVSYIICEVNLQPRGWLISSLALPLALFNQAVLTLVSMARYEFGRVDWKGRNVCLPVMRQAHRAAIYPQVSQPSK